MFGRHGPRSVPWWTVPRTRPAPPADAVGPGARNLVCQAPSRSETVRLDPRAPLVLDTRELGRRPGSLRRKALAAPAPADLGIEVLRVPEGSPIDLELRLEAVMEGVLVTGQAKAELAGECARCLGEIHDELVADFQELFVYEESDTARRGGRGRRAAGGRPARPRAPAAGRGGADAAVPAAVPGRLSGSVHRVWRAARGRPRALARRAGRPEVGGTAGARRADARPDRLTGTDRARPSTPRAAAADQRRTPWLSRSGRCRAATRATVARSGRPSRRRW